MSEKLDILKKKNLTKEEIEKKLLFELNTFKMHRGFDVEEYEWKVFYDNVYEFFKKKKLTNLFYSRILRVLHYSFAFNSYNYIDNVKLSDILRDMHLLDPEIFSYEELLNIRNKIKLEVEILKKAKIAELEKQKIVYLEDYLKLKRARNLEK